MRIPLPLWIILSPPASLAYDASIIIFEYQASNLHYEKKERLTYEKEDDLAPASFKVKQGAPASLMSCPLPACT